MPEQNSVQYPPFSQFIQILLCTLSNTSPMERGYIYLPMVAAKWRNHLCSENNETLSEYEEEIKLLEGHLKYLKFKAFISKLFYLCLLFFLSIQKSSAYKMYFFLSQIAPNSMRTWIWACFKWFVTFKRWGGV